MRSDFVSLSPESGDFHAFPEVVLSMKLVLVIQVPAARFTKLLRVNLQLWLFDC
jgi:hypothetical protein